MTVVLKYRYPDSAHSDQKNLLDGYYNTVAPTNALEDRKDYQDKGLEPTEYWEGYHLKEYALYLLTNKGTTAYTEKGNIKTSDPEYKKNCEKLDRILIDNGFGGGLKVFRNQASGQGYKSEVYEGFFKSLADFENTHFIKGFAGFLKFCSNHNRPLFQAIDYPLNRKFREGVILESILEESKFRLDNLINELDAVIKGTKVEG